MGAEKTEVILWVRTRRGVEPLYTSSFKLGADASIPAGPVGADAAAKGVTADNFSFARARNFGSLLVARPWGSSLDPSAVFGASPSG